MRPTKSGAIASVVYLAVLLGWLFASTPPGSPWLLGAWIAGVAVGGVFIPGEANQVSLARAYLAAPAASYSVSGEFGALAVVMAIAGLSDLVDGTVARRFERTTSLGGALDPLVDGVFMGATTLGLAVGGAFPLWLAAVVIARYLVPALAGGLLIAMGRRPELRHTLTGQVSTSLIIILVGGICLFRFMNQDATNLVVGAEVVIPIATVATWAHLALALRRPAAATEAG